MAGLVPAIHVLWCRAEARTWMPGTSPGMTSDLDAGRSNNHHCNEGVGSQLPQKRVAAGNLDLAGRRLEVELLDHAVLDQHRIALGADAEPVAGGVELHADRLGEIGVTVGEEHGFVAL